MMDVPRSLDGFVVEAPPASRFTNLVLPLKHSAHGRWFLKVFIDTVHPRVHIYDCAHREVFAYRLSRLLGDLVPETHLFSDKRFSVLVRDAGPEISAAAVRLKTGPARQQLIEQLATILVFSHWIGDVERAIDHIRVGSDGVVRSIDYQCAGPGAEHDVTHIVWPWIQTHTGRPNIGVDDVESMIHYGSYPTRADAGKDGVQRLIKEALPELMQLEPYLAPAARIAAVSQAQVEQAAQGLAFYQRGVNRFEQAPPINGVYIDFLMQRKGVMTDAFEKWTNWLARKQ